MVIFDNLLFWWGDTADLTKAKYPGEEKNSLMFFSWLCFFVAIQYNNQTQISLKKVKKDTALIIIFNRLRSVSRVSLSCNEKVLAVSY